MTNTVRLLDADELRRRIEAEVGSGGGVAAAGFRNGMRAAIAVLDAMPTTASKGWTRDEVLAELANHPDNVCEWLSPHTGVWYALCAPNWHPEVRRFDVRVVRSTPDPEWVPLTKLVGRIIHGETESVCRFEGYSEGVLWFPTEGPARAKDVAFNDDGMVAVRPEAAT